jgi:DNA-binding NarL/FixJ family response regulator
MRILVTDDHPLFLDGLKHILLQLEKDICIETADSAQASIKIIAADSAFDLILLDLGMPSTEGLSVLDYLRQKAIWIPTIIISATENLCHIEQALDAGALGFIPKSYSAQNIVNAIKTVLNGKKYIPEKLRQQLMQRPENKSSASFPQTHAVTQRQQQVLELLAQGYSNKKIAQLLALTEHTVKAHLSSIFQTLSVKNRTECVQAAREAGLVQRASNT